LGLRILDVLWISGLVFVLGFWKYLGNSSKFGDLSYGTYIVHYPIIQSLISLGVAKQNPVVFLMIVLSCVGFGAFLMWHLVEKRFLRKSSHYREFSMKASREVLVSMLSDPR
jgi:peptidoglycan/LPS O-acetylase OafA/YrhL